MIIAERQWKSALRAPSDTRPASVSRNVVWIRDGEALCQLLKERRLGVRVREVVREEVSVLPEFFAEI